MNPLLPVLPELIHLRHHELLQEAEQHRRTFPATRPVPAGTRRARRRWLTLL
uniref:hypothetical protein n=1 Tax=Microbispora cellulosiformans TaxID=2614688 RepID=UPI00177B72D5|nr:hypothetical protein [Microbispora cellulosiformans]